MVEGIKVRVGSWGEATTPLATTSMRFTEEGRRRLLEEFPGPGRVVRVDPSPYGERLGPIRKGGSYWVWFGGEWQVARVEDAFGLRWRLLSGATIPLRSVDAWYGPLSVPPRPEAVAAAAPVHDALDLEVSG